MRLTLCEKCGRQTALDSKGKCQRCGHIQGSNK